MAYLPIGGDNAFFLDLYARYRRDRASVPADWAVHFESLFGPESGAFPERADIAAQHCAPLLLDAYRRYGHFEADLDPLGLNESQTVPLLGRLRTDAQKRANEAVVMTFGGSSLQQPLSAFCAQVHAIYAHHVGLEASHLVDEIERDWLHDAFEAAFLAPVETSQLLRAIESVVLADEFETFARTKFPTKKRFGAEGAESLIVFLRELLDASVGQVDEVVMGGMHRGRLATLGVVLGKPLAALFGEIGGADVTDGTTSFTGDVPYHLGYTGDIVGTNATMRVRLLPHPSHLATVAPVTLGRARGAQAGSKSALCVVLHTDAAFTGQGVISEVMQLGGIAGYSVGGTVHVVVNNQIGFTTMPSEGRCAHYCTDIGKSAGVPIFHVNGDDPEAVARVAQIALRWRHRFGKDIVIDLVCYRRNGHNELDEPRFTQPRVYAAIEKHPSLRDSFLERLSRINPEFAARAAELARNYREALQTSYSSASAFRDNHAAPEQGDGWGDVVSVEEARLNDRIETGVPHDALRRIGLASNTLPDNLDVNWKVRKFYDARRAAIQAGDGLNFAAAEALAFATLLADGVSVRLAGQDTVRGTFTQRHLAVHPGDGSGNTKPLSAVACDAVFDAVNSPLSEYAVLGFEYGLSLSTPRQLVVWEAQFGDFLNGAQVMVDQYIVSAEAKWGLKSGLVLMLPHGLEGQGPDHSSARVERILQLCAAGNIIVANPSTPANLFHLLRRQVLASWRKPLFIISPKSLLRAKAAVSRLDAMGAGTAFEPVIGEAARAVRRVVLCSGKIYYELHDARAKAGREADIALVRLEQLYPFPRVVLQSMLERFRDGELVWCQEEPRNQGAWEFVRREMPSSVSIGYAGRDALPATAAGSLERHEREQQKLIACALDLGHDPATGTIGKGFR